MENQESQIFVNDEIKDRLIKSEKHISETKTYVEDALQVLQEELDKLEANIEQLNSVTENSEFSNDYKNITSKDTKVMSHPPEVIEKVKASVELSEKGVAEVNSLVADLILEHAQANIYKDKLEKLNQQFKDDLLKLESFNLN